MLDDSAPAPASLAPDPARSFAERAARSGQNQLRQPRSRSPARKHWCAPLCSLSTGISSAPEARIASITSFPPATRTSLFAKPDALARAARPRKWLPDPRRPQSPTSRIRLREPSRRATRACGAAGQVRAPEYRLLCRTARSSSSAVSSATTATWGRNSAICRASSSTFRPATKA